MSLESKPVQTEGRKKGKDRVLQAMWPEAPLGIMFYPRVIRRQEGLMAAGLMTQFTFSSKYSGGWRTDCGEPGRQAGDECGGCAACLDRRGQ